MKLSTGERTILANQFEVLSYLDKQNFKKLQQKAKIIRSGSTYFYDKVFDGLQDEIPYEICQEVFETLEMYTEINRVRISLTAFERDFSENIKFKGFPYFQHGTFMDFLVEHTNHFPDFHYNSYYGSSKSAIKYYRNMLKKFKELKWTKENYKLDAAGYHALLKAMY